MLQNTLKRLKNCQDMLQNLDKNSRKGSGVLDYGSKQILQYVIDFIMVIIILGGIALGLEINYYFFGISILAVIAWLFLQKKKKEYQLKMQKEIISKQWGKEHKGKREFTHIEKLYKYLLESQAPNFNIDNITWTDLNMDSVFSKMDHTMSLPGMQYLYHILRRPIFDKAILKKRNEVINSLLENKDISQAIQYPLFVLGKEEGKSIFKYFKDGINIDTRPAIIYRLLSYLPYLVLILFFIDPPKAILTLFGVMMINMLVYQLNKKKIYEDMDTFLYLGSLIKCADNIMKLNTDKIDLDQEELKRLLKSVGKVRKNITKINYNESFNSDKEILLHYYNMIILKEPNVFYKTVQMINQYREDFFKLYMLIGKIDTYISVASYKDGLDYYTEPSFQEDSSQFYLNVEGLYHPLLDDPVSYSIDLDNKGALVTGSNASGKSTFLRTIGINAILAQTLYFTLAEEYNSSYFKLLSSIGTTDNIVEGDSYFMAEAKSLKRILDSLEPNQPVLCILDEIFRGTNTAERISAALELLNYMIERNCCVIAATHDLELTNLVNERYNNYHFKETIEKNDIKFDYILREGPCTTRNAIAILKHLGYPVEIYEKAMDGAGKYLIK